MERYRIEDTSGQTLTPALYDELHTPEARAALIRFTDLTDTDAHALDADRSEEADHLPLPKRRHRALRRRLARVLLDAVFGRVWSAETELTADQIDQRLSDLLALHRDDLRDLLGHRDDQSQNPVAVLRWLLDKYGLKLTSHQRRIGGGQRERVYTLDAERLARMDDNARQRRAYLERQRTERAAAGGDLNPEYNALSRETSHPADRRTRLGTPSS